MPAKAAAKPKVAAKSSTEKVAAKTVVKQTTEEDADNEEEITEKKEYYVGKLDYYKSKLAEYNEKLKAISDSNGLLRNEKGTVAIGTKDLIKSMKALRQKNAEEEKEKDIEDIKIVE